MWRHLQISQYTVTEVKLPQAENAAFHTHAHGMNLAFVEANKHDNSSVNTK